MKTFRYALLTCRREMLWFPSALLAFFVVMAWMMGHPDVRFAISRAYLGFFVPLVGGILAAYAVIDDPALELVFSTPRSAVGILLSRFGLVLAVQTACALVFQLFALGMVVDFSPLGGAFGVQLAWVVPTLALSSVSSFATLAGARCATGACVASGIWLVQLLMRSWIMENAAWSYLFLGALEPRNPDLPASRAVLIGGSLLLLTASCRLLLRRERYLGRAVE